MQGVILAIRKELGMKGVIIGIEKIMD